MDKEYIVLVDLGIVVKAKSEPEAVELVRERFETTTEIKEKPITGISIHNVVAQELKKQSVKSDKLLHPDNNNLSPCLIIN